MDLFYWLVIKICFISLIRFRILKLNKYVSRKIYVPNTSCLILPITYPLNYFSSFHQNIYVYLLQILESHQFRQMWWQIGAATKRCTQIFAASLALNPFWWKFKGCGGCCCCYRGVVIVVWRCDDECGRLLSWRRCDSKVTFNSDDRCWLTMIYEPKASVYRNWMLLLQ